MLLLHLSISLAGQSSLRQRNYDKVSLHTRRLRKKATAVEAGAEGVEEEGGGGTGRQMTGLASERSCVSPGMLNAHSIDLVSPQYYGGLDLRL